MYTIKHCQNRISNIIILPQICKALQSWKVFISTSEILRSKWNALENIKTDSLKVIPILSFKSKLEALLNSCIKVLTSETYA